METSENSGDRRRFDEPSPSTRPRGMSPWQLMHSGLAPRALVGQGPCGLPAHKIVGTALRDNNIDERNSLVSNNL